MKKYALHPGYVRSKFDGDEHFITAGQLAHLHGVPMQECVVVPWDDPRENSLKGFKRDDLVHLYPSYHGNYRRLGDGS